MTAEKYVDLFLKLISVSLQILSKERISDADYVYLKLAENTRSAFGSFIETVLIDLIYKGNQNRFSELSVDVKEYLSKIKEEKRNY